MQIVLFWPAYSFSSLCARLCVPACFKLATLSLCCCQESENCQDTMPWVMSQMLIPFHFSQTSTEAAFQLVSRHEESQTGGNRANIMLKSVTAYTLPSLLLSAKTLLPQVK